MENIGNDDAQRYLRDFERKKQEYLLIQEEKERRINELRTNFISFIRMVFHTVDPGTPYKHNWHIDCIADHLEACRNKEIKRLIINIPPRCLKSMCAAIAWPAWILGHHPSERIIAASYAQQLANTHSMNTRLVMQSAWYQMVFPDTKIVRDQNEKSKFITTKRGMRFATSVGGTATGEGGNFIIVDDPLSAKQAASDVERETANNWIPQTLMSRLNDKANGVVVIIMQRLHEEDPTGVLLSRGGWHHLCLPAVAPHKTTIPIKLIKKKKVWREGELLHPKHLTKEYLEEQKRELGAYHYSGQYMQDPTPQSGGILQQSWWRKWPENEEMPKMEYLIQVYDTAYEEKEENDPSARTTWGVFRYPDQHNQMRFNLLLIEAWEGRLGYPDLKKEILSSYGEYKPDKIIIEKKSSGISLIQDLRKAHLPVMPFKPGDASKVFRAHTASIMLERGSVWYADRAWAKKVINQCASFPRGAHDDIVDTCVMAWMWLRRRYYLDLPDDDELDFKETASAAYLVGGKRRKGYG